MLTPLYRKFSLTLEQCESLYYDEIMKQIYGLSHNKRNDFLRSLWKNTALKIYNTSCKEWFYKSSDHNIGIKQYATYIIEMNGCLIPCYYNNDIVWGVDEEHFNMLIELRKFPDKAEYEIDYYSKYILDLSKISIDLTPIFIKEKDKLPAELATIMQINRGMKIIKGEYKL